MEKDEIQVGPVPELVAAELAVGDDDQAGRHGARLAASLGLAMTRGDLHPGEIERFLHDQLCDVGQAIAHFHDGQPTAQVRHRDAEHGGALELPQQLHLVLGVFGSGAGHPAAKLRREFLTLRDSLDQPRIEQLIEQQREGRNLLGEKPGLRAQIDQARERKRVLVEQCEVHGPTADALQHVQHPVERG